MNKTKKKMNSYLKMVLAMAGGGMIGAILGFVSVTYENGVRGFLNATSAWITAHVLLLMVTMTVIVFLLCIGCYWKGEKIVQTMKDQEDDELQEQMDEKYDFWGTVGVLVSNMGICMGMVLLAFSFHLDSGEHAMRMLYTAGLLVLCTLICGMYQVAMVKQMKRKDPMKRGDASDFRFQKEFLESCDEAERKAIYIASYKTLQLMKTMILFVLLASVIGHLFWRTGLTAVVLLGICHALMTIAYGIYSVRLQKNRLDG